MSMSGGVMSNVALDAALDELGMLSTITNRRQSYLNDCSLSGLAALDIPQVLDTRSRNANGGMRTRASSVSIVNGRRIRRYRNCELICCPSGDAVKNSETSEQQTYVERRRARRTQMYPNISFCPPTDHSNLDRVPYIALPIDSTLTSNLFKSRSMENIDARTSDDSVCAIDRESTSHTIASLSEVDSVSSGLHRLNVSE